MQFPALLPMEAFDGFTGNGPPGRFCFRFLVYWDHKMRMKNVVFLGFVGIITAGRSLLKIIKPPAGFTFHIEINQRVSVCLKKNEG